MKILTNLLKFIIIMVLTICVISIGLIKIVSSTILDKNYTLKILEETNFYEETHKLVQSNFENYIEQSGLNEEILKNICTEEKVKKDINLIISNIYNGANTKIDTTEIANNLNSNIEELGIKNSQNEKAIQQYVAYICNEYTQTIMHTNYEQQINNIYNKIVQALNKLNIILLIIFVISIILIIIINKNISKILQHIGIPGLGTSIFIFTIYNIICSRINIQGIKIFNDAFSNAIVSIIQDILTNISVMGIITLIISLILIIAHAIIETKNNNCIRRVKRR